MAPLTRRLDDAFKLSVSIKGLDGALELIGGLLLLFVSPTSINHLAHTLTQNELSQDPHDFVALHILRYSRTLGHGGHLFAAAYLISHGVAKVVLVVALLRRQHWAYPAMIALLAAFIVYQCYRIAIDASLPLTLLTIFDAFVVWLTWREWQAHGRVRASAPSAPG